VPADLEHRLAVSGSRERYQLQFERFGGLGASVGPGHVPLPDPRLESLARLIHHYQKGYDQEGYMV
ncbi:MAG: hypothetical protein IKN31_08810, partial [Bacteroidales bacterium]|nr:hypothetical protein [Bacteroidales bacterium]